MHLRLLALVCLLAAGCGGGDEPPPDRADAARAAAREYVDALRGARWEEACERMTRAARRAVAEGGSCAAALAAGAALPPAALDSAARLVAGAPLRLAGDEATLGPLGDLPRPLRLRWRDGRWLVAP